MREVRIPMKIDMDVCGVGLILDVHREDRVEVVRNVATREELEDPAVICIECGGSGGGRSLNNWDHHGGEGAPSCATLQAFLWKFENKIAEAAAKAGSSLSCIVGPHCLFSCDSWGCYQFWPGYVKKLAKLAEYIQIIDVEGPRALPGYGKVKFPTLSDIFSGMLLLVKDPVEQFFRGVEILKVVVRSDLDPFDTISISEFKEYAHAKADHNQKAEVELKKAQWTTTSSGRRLAYVESSWYGVVGVLYGAGAEIVVALNPDFHGTRKFTVAGNGIRVDLVLNELNARESGWGGPSTGTIVGSPRSGSSLRIEEVVEIVKRLL